MFWMFEKFSGFAKMYKIWLQAHFFPFLPFFLLMSFHNLPFPYCFSNEILMVLNTCILHLSDRIVMNLGWNGSQPFARSTENVQRTTLFNEEKCILSLSACHQSPLWWCKESISNICFSVISSCMDASIAVRPVFNRFQSVVITSGVRISFC